MNRRTGYHQFRKNDTEEMVQIQVVTLRAYLSELAMERAFDEGITEWFKLEARMNQLLMTELCTSKEFVKVTPDYIRVGVNCDWIDDEIISHALRLVSRLDNLSSGTMVEFGEMVTVYENEVQRNQRTH